MTNTSKRREADFSWSPNCGLCPEGCGERASHAVNAAALSREKFESTEARHGERGVADLDRKEPEAEPLESDIVDPPHG